MSARLVPAPLVATPAASAETVDVADLARSVRRQWVLVLGVMLLGLATAAAVLAFAPRRFTADASLLLRSAPDASGSILSRIGLPTELAPSGLAAGLKSPLETELQLLVSRDVVGAVVDSLGLQARVLGRAGVPSARLIVPATYAGSFRRRTYAFERQGDGRYQVSGPDTTLVAAPGVAVRLPVVGAVTIAPGAPLASFRVQFEDREDAIARAVRSTGVDKRGGEVAAVSFGARDSLTAAAVPNAIVATYLDRRRTVDRGVNERRYEFLRAQADSVASQLAVAENALRRQQERSGVLDPELTGRLGAEAARDLRERAGAIDVERHALGQLMAQVQAGTLTPRQLAAYPTFLKSEAVNALLTQMSTLETERTRMLERRTERDPEVIAITTSVENLERQLAPLGAAYASSLDREAEAIGRQLDTVQTRLAALPGQAEASLQGQRAVKQLATTFAALQAQIVDARLAAIGEGGQVRRIDVAEPPKRPSFPRPALTLLAGGVGGLLLGILAALVRGATNGRLWTPADAERATLLPAYRAAAGVPLLLGAGARAGTIVVVRVGASAADVAAVTSSISAEAALRGHAASVLDLAALGANAGHALADAERATPLVVVAADTLDDPRTVALLEPPRAALLAVARGARRDDVLAASAAVARLGVSCLGVAFADGAPAGAVTAARPVLRASRAAVAGAPRVPADGD